MYVLTTTVTRLTCIHLQCGMGCIESTPRLTPEEIIMVRTKLEMIAVQLEGLQDFYDTKNYHK